MCVLVETKIKNCCDKSGGSTTAHNVYVSKIAEILYTKRVNIFGLYHEPHTEDVNFMVYTLLVNMLTMWLLHPGVWRNNASCVTFV